MFSSFLRKSPIWSSVVAPLTKSPSSGWKVLSPETNSLEGCDFAIPLSDSNWLQACLVSSIDVSSGVALERMEGLCSGKRHGTVIVILYLLDTPEAAESFNRLQLELINGPKVLLVPGSSPQELLSRVGNLRQQLSGNKRILNMSPVPAECVEKAKDVVRYCGGSRGQSLTSHQVGLMAALFPGGLTEMARCTVTGERTLEVERLLGKEAAFGIISTLTNGTRP